MEVDRDTGRHPRVSKHPLVSRASANWILRSRHPRRHFSFYGATLLSSCLLSLFVANDVYFRFVSLRLFSRAEKNWNMIPRENARTKNHVSKRCVINFVCTSHVLRSFIINIEKVFKKQKNLRKHHTRNVKNEIAESKFSRNSPNNAVITNSLIQRWKREKVTKAVWYHLRCFVPV